MRNVNLDLSKVLFAIIIVICHSFLLGNQFYNNYCFLGVEFFFICTGYFLAQYVLKHKDSPVPTSTFLKHKISIIIVTFLAAEVLSVVVKWLVACHIDGAIDLKTLIYNMALSINELLFLQMANIPCYYGTGVGWYFSAMILGSAILYPIVKKNIHFCEGLAPVIGVLCIGLVYSSCGVLWIPEAQIYHIPSGLIRGIGDMLLGLFAFTAVQKMQKIDFNTNGKIVLGIIELSTLIISCIFMIGYNRDTRPEDIFQFTVILMLWVFIVIVLSEKSILHINKNTKLIQKMSDKIGKLSLLIILNHYWVLLSINMLFTNSTPAIKILYSIIGIVSAIIACTLLEKLFQKSWTRIKKTIKTRDY